MSERSAPARLKRIGVAKSPSADESARSGVMAHSSTPTEVPSSPEEIAPGVLLDGKYLIGPIIGSGAFGLVFEGKNLELDEKVAIKVLRPEIAVDKAMVGRFAREAKSAAAIKSEYVCTVYDVGMSTETVPYIVMEYLEGSDLGSIVESSGPLAPRTAVEYALQVCEALAVAHAKGIVHRDIKPENLLLTKRAGGIHIVKVLDFGISKAALTGSIFGNELPIVKTVNLVGTPLYMSPEQVRTSGGVDVRSDIWSLGMVLYEILTGYTAFEGATITEICAAILETKPKPIELHRNDLPSGLVEVISRCLEKDLRNRYQNVAELALALMPFGPKRSRLNVERALTVLQAAGQVDPSWQIESVAPPASSEALATPLNIPRPSLPFGDPSGPPSGPSASGASSAVSSQGQATVASSSQGQATIPSASQGQATILSASQGQAVVMAPSHNRTSIGLAVLALVGGVIGSIVFLSGVLGSKSPKPTAATTTVATTTAAATTAVAAAVTTPESTPAANTQAPAAQAPTVTTPLPVPDATPAAKAVTTPPYHPAPNFNRSKGPAPATASAPPASSPTQQPSVAPAAKPTETGRTFRREL